MTRNWFHIAKAEFQVQTSGFRLHRKSVVLGFFSLGVVWALIIAPYLMAFVLTETLGIPQQVLVMIMPGLLRAGVMLVWVILLILPLSNALQEVKLGQWEILLSNNVKTREILVGSFVGKLTVYGIYVLYLAPLLVAPFAHVLDVAPIGQALMYFTVFLTTVGTIWLSQLLVTAIQSRLGASPRGKDIANAVAIALSFVAILPLVGLQLFAPLMSEILGMNVFLVFPFTWSADLMSQIAVAFNGIGLAAGGLDMALGLHWSSNALLLGLFSITLIVLGLVSADHLFTIRVSTKAKSVANKQSENVILRGVRRVAGVSFGVLVVTGFKDFARKAQNLSRLALLLLLASIAPVFIHVRGGELDLTSVNVMMSLMLGFLGAQVFGGTGFLESKDQLWMIQAAPHGVKRYMEAKTVQSILLIAPIVLVPALLYTALLGLSASQVLFLVSTSFMSCVGGALVGIGIAASNPTYEDTKSGAYTTNNIRAMGLVAVSFMWYFVADMVLSILGFSAVMNYIWESQVLSILAQVMPLPIVGLAVVLVGSVRLSNRE
ncbi:MAG: hypothetical protein JSW61_03470 [Candidatus Thorarchaeota archaeon]|nr:MAG: hypothetical protein JSW61_03470 [Candidatus Thorarchaeota archaeon]